MSAKIFISVGIYYVLVRTCTEIQLVCPSKVLDECAYKKRTAYAISQTFQRVQLSKGIGLGSA